MVQEEDLCKVVRTVLGHAACVLLMCTKGEREVRILTQQVCLKLDREGHSRRAMLEEEGTRDKSSCGGKQRWSPCMDDEMDEVFPDMDGCYSPDLRDEWWHWHMDEPELESDETAAAGRKRMQNWKREEEGNEMTSKLVDG